MMKLIRDCLLKLSYGYLSNSEAISPMRRTDTQPFALQLGMPYHNTVHMV